MKVLLIEDDELVADGIATVLETENITVRVVKRGEEAVPSIEKDRPDAVILDVGLPDLGGVDVFAAISARWPDLPVLFSSGHADESNLRPYLRPGQVEFLAKPYPISTLLLRLENLVNR